ncbi:MAG: hypothetical protein QW103_02940 [Candidatus Pacearchaeota archaeon]
MVERDKSHDEELVRWATYVRENPDKWKSKLKSFLDSQIIISRRARKKMKEKLFKTAFIFIILFLLLGTLSFVFSANIDDLGKQIESGGKKLEETKIKIDRMTKEDYKWEVLSKNWREILLRNKGIAFLDGIFKKGNIVFVVLFGRDYSLSLTLLFLIILWFYFWNQFYKILSTFSTFGNSTSLIISLGMTIILAQIQFFDKISELLFKFIFYRQGVWGWVWYLISVGAIILFSMIFSRFFSSLKIVVLKMKEEQYRKKLLGELEEKNKFFSILAEAFREMFKKQ